MEKFREANGMLKVQQEEMDRLRNELAGARELVRWHAAQAGVSGGCGRATGCVRAAGDSLC